VLLSENGRPEVTTHLTQEPANPRG
jgi:hypothetical protein